MCLLIVSLIGFIKFEVSYPVCGAYRGKKKEGTIHGLCLLNSLQKVKQCIHSLLLLWYVKRSLLS